MVASCPTKFDDVEVKRKCEVKLPYAAPFNITDNLPVTFTDVGQTYKNRYCAQCNTDHDLDPAFWHVSLLCKFQFFSLEIFTVISQFQFAEALLYISKKTCNIVFRYKSSDVSHNLTPDICKYDTMIDTCAKENSNKVLDTLCKDYFWPVEIQVLGVNKLFKNYACILCNGVRFINRCRVYKASEPVLIEFRNQNITTPNISIANDISSDEQGLINRYFPNKDRMVHCKKGYVYDNKKVF
jgi:hypothetical protein